MVGHKDGTNGSLGDSLNAFPQRINGCMPCPGCGVMGGRRTTYSHGVATPWPAEALETRARAERMMIGLMYSGQGTRGTKTKAKAKTKVEDEEKEDAVGPANKDTGTGETADVFVAGAGEDDGGEEGDGSADTTASVAIEKELDDWVGGVADHDWTSDPDIRAMLAACLAMYNPVGPNCM